MGLSELFGGMGFVPQSNLRYFFSTLNTTVKNSLKTSPVSIPPGNNPSTAFLLAETDGLTSSSNGSIVNTAIWHDGSTENRIFNHLLNELNLSSSKVSISQVRTSHENISETSVNQLGIGQISTIKIGMSEISTSQISFSQVGVSQTGLPQLGSSEVSSAQIAPLHKDLANGRGTQIDSAQIGSIQFIRPLNVNFGEIPLPSSVALQQLFNVNTSTDSHNSNLQNTTVPTWLEFLQGTTPFNLNIEIADLPTGQLAEANITGFDPIGRPNAGTLYLDTDANSLGWYIDPTPWDNSKFSQTLTTSAYRATPDSLAYGHYDLLTTILHETAHLQGFIAGYSNYDTHIQTIKNNKTFIGDTFSAILTPDGSHLNSSVYTYDLINTTLTPGVRNLPSTLDIQILNTLRNLQPIASAQTPISSCSAIASTRYFLNFSKLDLRK
jgi:hypothetical protein